MGSHLFDDLLAALPHLSGAAAKLALHRLATGGASLTNRELKGATGIRDEHTLINARRELHLAKLWDRLGEYGEKPQYTVNPSHVNNPHVNNSHVKNPQSPVNNPQLGKIHSPLRGLLQAEVTTGTVVAPPPGVADLFVVPPVPETPSLLTQACEADRLDASGEWHVRNSPVNVRRKAQIEAVQRAMRELYGVTVAEGTVKTWLAANEQSAEEVVAKVEQTHDVKPKLESAVAYLTAVLTRPRPPKGPAAALLGGTVGGGVAIEGGPGPVPTAPVPFILEKSTPRTALMEEAFRRNPPKLPERFNEDED